MSEQHPDELRRQAEQQLAARAHQIESLERNDLVSLAHELAVHQIELEIQNEELVRTRALAEEARDRYLDLYDFAPVSYFTLDEHNRIVEANLTGCCLLNAKRQDLLHARFTKFIPEEETDRFYFHRKETLEGTAQQTCELKMRDTRGVAFDARLESVRAAEDRLRVAVIDISERKRAEEALRQSTEQLALELAATQRLQEVSVQLIQEDNVNALYDKILDTAMATMRSDFASIQMLSAERGSAGELRLLGHRGFSPQAAKFWEWVGPASESTCGIALRTGQRVIAPDVQTFESMAGSDDQKTYLQTGIHAVQTTPLVSRSGRVVGMISTHWRQPHQPGERDLRMLDLLARQAADLIESAKTGETLRELNATLESKVARRTAELEHRARQLQKLTLELSVSEDRERRRIAQVLHDDLQQVLAAATFHLSLLKNRIARDPEQQALAGKVEEMIQDGIAKSRSLSHELSPAVLHRNDLAGILAWLGGQMRVQHGLTVHVDAPGEMRLQSEAITIFLFRTAQELLFNVAKHAGVDEARIRLRRRGQYVRLSVSDRGCGFDAREQRETGGFGLFSIRERAELLGGFMRIRSRPGEGSTFRIVVPAQEAAGTDVEMDREPAGRAAESRHARGQDESRLRVLVADDHRIVRQGIVLLLAEEDDIEVVAEAATGHEAVELADQFRPDVVVMDVSMPLMNGDEAARRIKRHLPQTRIVAISVYDETGIIDKMRQAGADSYILKTAPSGELLAAIRSDH